MAFCISTNFTLDNETAPCYDDINLQIKAMTRESKSDEPHRMLEEGGRRTSRTKPFRIGSEPGMVGAWWSEPFEVPL
jgi:hypothetical protein